MSKTRKYEFIDALRGIAILGVVAVHSSQWSEPSFSLLKMIASNGKYGVQLFYIASAFTLFMSMDTRKNIEKHSLRNFFIRRFFRIAPMFYCGIIAYLFIFGFSLRIAAPHGIEWWYIPLTALFLHGWTPETINSVVPGGWSIAVEMIFYLCVPFLFHRIKSIKLSLIFVVGSLIIGRAITSIIQPLLLHQYPSNEQYLVITFFNYWFFSQLPVFGLGILAYFLFKNIKQSKTKGLVLIFVAVAGFILTPFLPRILFKIFGEPFLYSLSFFTLTMALCFYPGKMLVNVVTQNLGKLSYSLYLTHFAVLELGKHEALWLGFSPQGDIGFLAVFVFVLIGSSILSSFTHRFIEQPGINFGKYLIKTYS